MANKKVKTIDLKGKQYAQVVDRLKEFREANPNGLIETEPTFIEGKVMFKARIVKDKSDENSAEATGHALSSKEGEKSFEKLETIAVGRALAILGYAASGDVASSEEMEEFDEWKQEKFQADVLDAQEQMGLCETVADLARVWADLPVEVKKALEEQKNELKKRLESPVDETAQVATKPVAKKRVAKKIEKPVTETLI